MLVAGGCGVSPPFHPAGYAVEGGVGKGRVRETIRDRGEVAVARRVFNEELDQKVKALGERYKEQKKALLKEERERRKRLVKIIRTLDKGVEDDHSGTGGETP